MSKDFKIFLIVIFIFTTFIGISIFFSKNITNKDGSYNFYNTPDSKKDFDTSEFYGTQKIKTNKINNQDIPKKNDLAPLGFSFWILIIICTLLFRHTDLRTFIAIIIISMIVSSKLGATDFAIEIGVAATISFFVFIPMAYIFKGDPE